MGEIEHVPSQPQTPGDKPSEKVGEDLPEGDFNIPMERVRESASEDSSGFGQAQQFITAIRGEEKRHQQKEQELSKVLRDYIQKQSGNEELITTLIALLDRNVLAGMLLTALTLSDTSLTEMVLKQLPTGSKDAPKAPDASSTSQSLQQQFGASPWDEQVRPDIESWLFKLREICAAYPKRLIKDISHENRDADQLFQKLLSLIMHEFFSKRNLASDDHQITVFSEAIVQRLIDQMAEQIEDQDLLS